LAQAKDAQNTGWPDLADVGFNHWNTRVVHAIRLGCMLVYFDGECDVETFAPECSG
jgi:hypothetical protein